MISIKARLHFYYILILASMAGFGVSALQAHNDMIEIHRDVAISLEIRALLNKIESGKFDKQTHKQLQDYRATLHPADRAEALSDIIQSYAERDLHLLDKRMATFLKNEKKIIQASGKKIQERTEDAKKAVALTIATPAVSLLLLILFIRRNVFRSIDRLSKRMMDFLADRYSFQLSEPPKNELGDLSRTFNYLAQRVINNMDELKLLDQAKSEFLNMASHELRTPMTSIKGSLSLLANGVMGTLDEESLHLVKIAEVETDRLIRLTNDILDLAKIEARRLPLAPAWCNWEQILERTTAGLTGLSHNANVAVVVEPFEPLEVFADKDRIQQILTNLVSNAVKFSKPGSAVFIRTKSDASNHLLIQVQDYGPGIPRDQQGLIFQKFRQATNSEAPPVKGTGLGLAIAKALVEEHKGTIGVSSVEGKGSVFYFTLPEWRKVSDGQGETAA